MYVHLSVKLFLATRMYRVYVCIERMYVCTRLVSIVCMYRVRRMYYVRMYVRVERIEPERIRTYLELSTWYVCIEYHVCSMYVR